MKRFQTSCKSGLFGALICLILSCFAQAGLVIDPLRTVLECLPGEEYEGSISLVYEGTEPIWIQASFMDQSQADKAGSSWVTVDTGPERILLEPGMPHVFSYVVILPEGAEGEYRGRLRFLELPKDSGSKGGIGVMSAISVPLYVNVKGTERYDAELRRFEIKSFSPLHIVVYMKNTGNVRLSPEGGALSIVDNEVEQQVYYRVLGREYPPIFPDEVKAIEIREDHFKPNVEGSYTLRFNYRLPDGRVIRTTQEQDLKTAAQADNQ